MPAAGRADVVARDLHPLEIRRRLDHPLEQLTIASLQLILLAQPQARLADPRRQRIPNGLQLAQAQRPWLTRGGGDSGVEAQPRERLGDQRAELSFQPPNLPPQLNPRQLLVPTEAKLAVNPSFEQVGHTRLRV